MLNMQWKLCWSGGLGTGYLYIRADEGRAIHWVLGFDSQASLKIVVNAGGNTSQ